MEKVGKGSGEKSVGRVGGFSWGNGENRWGEEEKSVGRGGGFSWANGENQWGEEGEKGRGRERGVREEVLKKKLKKNRIFFELWLYEGGSAAKKKER